MKYTTGDQRADTAFLVGANYGRSVARLTEVWMLDYLNAVFPRWGVFESEEAAWAWVQTHDPERKEFYTPFAIPVNYDLEHNFKVKAPNDRYANPR